MPDSPITSVSSPKVARASTVDALDLEAGVLMDSPSGLRAISADVFDRRSDSEGNADADTSMDPKPRSRLPTDMIEECGPLPAESTVAHPSRRTRQRHVSDVRPSAARRGRLSPARERLTLKGDSDSRTPSGPPRAPTKSGIGASSMVLGRSRMAKATAQPAFLRSRVAARGQGVVERGRAINARPRHVVPRAASSGSRTRRRLDVVPTSVRPTGTSQPSEKNCYAYCLAKKVDLQGLERAWTESLKRRSMRQAAAVANPSRNAAATAPKGAREESGTKRHVDLPENVLVVPLNTEVKLMKVGTKDCFVFAFGCLVCWSLKPEEAVVARGALLPFLIDPLQAQHVEEDHIDITRREGGKLEVCVTSTNAFERLAMAFALAQSVRLGSLELQIDRWIIGTRDIPHEMASTGHVHLSSNQVTRMIGELFCLKHEVNLETDILDTPEFFWDYGEYEPLYKDCREHLDIDHRVSVLNQRFEVLEDLFDALETELHERQETYLTYAIIVLCALEAVAMGLRLYTRVFAAPSTIPHVQITPVLSMLSWVYHIVILWPLHCVSSWLGVL